MIQRIQSIYLLLAALFSGAVAFFVPFFVSGDKVLPLLHFPVFTAAFVLSALISLFSIFRYKNRQQQVVAGRLNIIINFVIFGFLIYYWYQKFSLAPENMQLGIFIPVIVVILISLANRGIMKDELLVRSMDRLR